MIQVVKECLRLHPPAAFVNKGAPKSTKLSGYDIAEGTSILVSVLEFILVVKLASVAVAV